MIISYQTGQAAICQTIVKSDPTALAWLLGDKGKGGDARTSSGWWGFLKHGIEGIDSYDDVIRFIWSTVTIHGTGGPNNNPAPKCGGQNTTSSVLAGAGAAANIAAFTLPGAITTAGDAWAALNIWNPVGWVVLGATAIGTATTISSLTGKGCMP